MYEIEVELIRLENDTVESAQKRLVKGVGEVLRGIQKSSILIRKSKKEQVLKEYQKLTGTNRFLGCLPVTLEQRNFTDVIDDSIPNIRNSYNVTDKADGLRCLAFTNSKGELYLIDMAMNVYKTGLEQLTCRESIIDGEWVTRTKQKQPMNAFLAFDIYYTIDESMPDHLSNHYTQKFMIPEDVTILRVQAYRDGKPIGKLLNIPIESLKKRAIKVL